MNKSKVIGFDANAMVASMMKTATEEQTRRLIAYAKDKVRLIGDAIQLYNSKHHFDRTGNLLNSICWGVAYSARLIDYGFYREANIKSYNTGRRDETSQSFLHEFFREKEAYEVDGRYLAERFIKKYGRNSAQGWWRVWFAILAPYWGYWEEGFTMKRGGGMSGIPQTSSFMKFSVMSEFHDKVERELSPAKVKLDVFVAPYSSFSLKSDFKKYHDDTKHPFKYRR